MDPFFTFSEQHDDDDSHENYYNTLTNTNVEKVESDIEIQDIIKEVVCRE
jgi:hypothetical protein